MTFDQISLNSAYFHRPLKMDHEACTKDQQSCRRCISSTVAQERNNEKVGFRVQPRRDDRAGSESLNLVLALACIPIHIFNPRQSAFSPYRHWGGNHPSGHDARWIPKPSVLNMKSFACLEVLQNL